MRSPAPAVSWPRSWSVLLRGFRRRCAFTRALLAFRRWALTLTALQRPKKRMSRTSQNYKKTRRKQQRTLCIQTGRSLRLRSRECACKSAVISAYPIIVPSSANHCNPFFARTSVYPAELRLLGQPVSQPLFSPAAIHWPVSARTVPDGHPLASVAGRVREGERGLWPPSRRERPGRWDSPVVRTARERRRRVPKNRDGARRSRGGCRTQIHSLTDRRSHPLCLRVTGDALRPLRPSLLGASVPDRGLDLDEIKPQRCLMPSRR